MRFTKFTMAVITALAVGTTSCSDDDDPLIITMKLNQTQIDYDSEGVWTEVATNTSIISQGFVFNHEGEDSPWGLIWRGFTPSRSSDTAIYSGDWLSHQFNVMSGGGMSGEGTPFMVCFWNNAETEDMTVDERSCHIYYSNTIEGTKHPFKPQSVYVNNACYTYYTMKDGDQWSKQFTQGDYCELIAHGVKTDGTETTTSIRLADCTGTDTDKWFIDEWTVFNLTPLGEITDIYFTMKSTDEGQWGMNTPAFFCIDRLSAEAQLPEN